MASKLILATLIALTSTSAAPLAFDVASVKANRTDRQGGLQILPGGRVSIVNVPLLIILATAYNVPIQSSRLIGIPSWAGAERFDIEATPPEDAIPQGATSGVRLELVRQMLQTLLAERFKLTIRRETRDQSVYAAVIGKNGIKMERSKLTEEDCQAHAVVFAEPSRCHSLQGGRGRGLYGDAIAMSDLVIWVANWTDHPVVDKTGLKGLFKIRTDGWLPMEARPAAAPDATGEDGKLIADQPTIFEIFERLGLRLQLDRAPVDVFRIEHLERPSEN
jgi:uncharacterized protein (TIGR03435 family)